MAELAAQVNYSKGHLSKVESGLKAPSVELARQCDNAFGASGELAALVQTLATRDSALADEGHGEAWVVSMTADGCSEFQAINRRSLLAGGAAGVASCLLPPPAGPGDPAVGLPAYRVIFDELRRLGQASDPATVTPVLVTATNALRGLAMRASATHRQPVLRLAARFAEYTGWMAQEKGDETAALWWTHRAVEMARAADDQDLVAYSLVRRAEIALYRNDFVSTIALAKRAQAEPSRLRVRGLASLREAQGHAMAGEVAACRRALDRATGLMREASTREIGDGSPVLGTSNASDPVAFAAGWCKHDLGDLVGAVATLSPELGQLPASAHRARARHAARLALALAKLREIEQSCAVIEPVLEQTRLVDSATVRTDLAKLHRTLNRWCSHHTVQRIAPRLASTLRTSLTTPHASV